MQTPDEIRAIADPVQRIAAVNAALTEGRTELTAITRDTVREMRKTMSLAQVATALGVSRTRVQQLEKAK